MAKSKKSPESPEAFSARDAARADLPEMYKALVDEAKSGKGISRITAIKAVIELAELETLPKEKSPALQLKRADPSKRKVVSITEAIG